jgi:hypothetical protein
VEPNIRPGLAGQLAKTRESASQRTLSLEQPRERCLR